MTDAHEKSNIHRADPGRVKVDAGGTIKALQFGTYGTLAAGVGAAVAAANALPLFVVGAVPIAGAVGSALYGYFSAKSLNDAQSEPGKPSRSRESSL